MKLELLAECVTTLAECDVDNPNDQKTISVCENYIIESYNYYLESCELNDTEPLSEREYIQNLMLNEGFFKKLLAGAAIAGGAVAAAKGVNAINSNARANGQAAGLQRGQGFKNNVANTAKTFGQNAKNFYNQNGGLKGSLANAAKTSVRRNVADQQYSGATRNTVTERNVATDADGNKYKTNTVQHSMSIARGKDAKNAVKNGQTLQGQTNITSKQTETDAQGNTKEVKSRTVDANSKEGKRMANLRNGVQSQREVKPKKAASAPAANNAQPTQTPPAANTNTAQPTPPAANNTNNNPPTPPKNNNGAPDLSGKPARDKNGNPLYYDQYGKPIDSTFGIRPGTVGYTADGKSVTFEESMIMKLNEQPKPLTPSIRMPAKFK